MSSVTTLPFFRLILIYISGLLLVSYYLANRVITLMLLVGLIIVYLAVYIRSGTTTSAWLNLIGLLVVFFIGYSNLLLSIAEKTRLPKWIEDNQHLEGYSVCIEKVYHPLSCKALITHIRDQTGWHNNHTYIQLYFSKQSSYKPKKGDRLLIAGTPVRRLSFDRVQHANYLIPLPCIHRHFLKQIDQDFRLVNAQLFYRSGKWAASIKKWCSQTFQKQLKEQQSIALVSTLLWGDKEGLSLDLQKAYADTGTIHVLAISGLHVGMFYVLIHTVCRFIFSSISRFILPELSTCLWLWLYAWLCHFRPPILRATIMLTMARLGFLIGRGSNSYNGLLASAFTLLLWNPCLLFNCGFQLSYLATLGILYLQPYIYRFIPLQNYWLQKIWTATTLSIAAQLSTLPLILYYFKQFPLYFIVANWLVVPAIFLILTLSLGLLVVSHLPIVNKLLGCTLEKLIFATNEWVCCVAKWPMSRLSPCLVNGHTVALLYIALLLVCLFLNIKILFTLL
ncbi:MULTISPECIES: ComEC/Rec2 family competence protein [unclassified Candidatus Cardinium]|uniref:ComEC/Rec2 family competence protein n=1 Tax=unclassified Candidatus Cardinium TaxID=2641185 RepID=UPI001FB208F6|nr:MULTISPECIES: ComEC/Rec2 family competence protein [unclassified Candidatus Cardinium]